MVRVIIDGAQDGRHEVDAHLLALAVDVAVGASAEIYALEGAGGIFLRRDNLLDADLAGPRHEDGLAGKELGDLTSLHVEGCLDHGTLRGKCEHLLVGIPESGAYSPGVAHSEEFAAAGHSAKHIAAVPYRGALLQDVGHVDVLFDECGDVSIGETLVHGNLEAALALAVEAMAQLLEKKECVGNHAGMLPFHCDVPEDILHVCHVEIGTDAKILGPPVVPAQEGMDKRNAAASRGGVPEVTHINLTGKGKTAACQIGVGQILRGIGGQSFMHSVENLADGSGAFGSFAEHKLLAGGGVELDAGESGPLLTSVVLLLHHEIELVEAIHPGAIFVLKITQGLAQPNHGHATFVF